MTAAEVAEVAEHKTRFPIFIPSKGRAGQSPTISLLQMHGVKFKIVVEPAETAMYQAAYPVADILTLDADNRGIAFARQSIRNHVNEMGFEWYWQIDDDIAGFIHAATHAAVSPQLALQQAETLVSDTAWVVSFNEKTWENPYGFACGLFSASTPIDYDETLRLKSDVDFALKHVAAGYEQTIRPDYLFKTHRSGRGLRGGLHPLYYTAQNDADCMEIARRYPDSCKVRHTKAGCRLNTLISKNR